MPNPILKQAVVIGAGMGGLAAAKAVAPHFEKVIVFDRDVLPDAPASRPGTPQARHTHGLLAGGHRALERLFPGIELDLVEAGAVRIRMSRDARQEIPGFDPLPQRDFGFDLFSLSRPALECVCRRRVEREPNIEFRPRSRVTEVIATPDNRGVAGVRFEDTRGTQGSLAAALVVDASGRAAPTLRFLEATGSARPTTIEIGIDQAYATAVFEKPEDAPTDWLIAVHAPTPPSSSRYGLIVPIEGRRWSVSVCVNHGEPPPDDIDGFMAFVKSFRLPTIYNAIRGAKRVGDIARYGMASSVLRAFDRLDGFPRGLVPLGNSVCRYPPVNGQGMSVAAQEACALSSLLESRQESVDPLAGLAESFFARNSAASRSSLVGRDERSRLSANARRAAAGLRSQASVLTRPHASRGRGPRDRQDRPRGAVAPQAAERAERAPACQPSPGHDGDDPGGQTCFPPGRIQRWRARSRANKR